MDSVLTLLELEAVMFLLMIIGGVLRRTNRMTVRGQESLSTVLMSVILPCNIFKSFLVEVSGSLLVDFLQVLVICALVMAVACLGGRYFFRRIPGEERQLMRYGLVNGNVAFLGLPVCEGLYGDAGVLNATIYMIPHRILVWSYGLVILQGRQEGKSRLGQLRELVLNPCMLAAELGLLCMILGLRPPSVIQLTVEQLSKCLFPLSMLIIGGILSQIDLKTIFDRQTLYFSLFRLGVLPLVGLLCGLAIRCGSVVIGVAVALAGMPCASVTAIMAAKYHLNQEFASKMISSATLLSAVTIPLWNLAVRAVAGGV